MSGLEADVSLSPFDISSPDFGLLVGCDSPEGSLPEAWGREGLEGQGKRVKLFSNLFSIVGTLLKSIASETSLPGDQIFLS